MRNILDKINTAFSTNKKLPIYLVALVTLGALALFFNRLAREPDSDHLSHLLTGTQSHQESNQPIYYMHEPDASQIPTDFLYERALERRLEEFFSMVEGAGQVRVMVSPTQGRETVFAVDVNESRSYSTEEDAQGGSRETRQQSTQEQTVMVTDRAGADRPLVLREIEPRIEGVVIIAEGGDSPFVRDALTRAARAVLGIDAHMIQVLTMSME